MLLTIPIAAKLYASLVLPAYITVIYQTTSPRISEKNDGTTISKILFNNVKVESSSYLSSPLDVSH